MAFDLSELLQRLSTTQDSDTQDKSFPMPDSLANGIQNTFGPSQGMLPQNPGMGDVKMSERQPAADSSLQGLNDQITSPASDLDLSQLYDRFLGSGANSASIQTKSSMSGPFRGTAGTPSAPEASASTPTPKPEPVDEDADMKKAIADRNDKQMGAMLLKAGSQLGNAIARTNIKSGEDTSNELMKLSGQGVEDLKAGQKLKSEKLQNKLNETKLTKETALMDPNSKESQSFRQSLEANFPGIANKYGDMWKDVTAADQSLVFEPLKLAENIQARKDLKQMQMEQIKVAKTEKETTKDHDRLDKMNKLITAEVSNSRGAFGKAAINKQSVENAEALIKGYTNLDEIPNTQLFELARALDRVVSTGSPTISGTEHLTPDTIKTRIAQKLQFVSGQQRGGNAGSFVKTMSDSLDREKSKANEQLMTTQKSLLSSYKDLQQKHPEDFRFVLSQHGLPESIMETDETNKANAKAASSTPKASVTQAQLKDYAAKHQMDEEKAKQFLTSQGYVIQ